MDANDPHSDFPRNRSIIGMSTIATGHSGVDMYLASRSFDYYQLWLYTHNKLYKKIATVLAYDTKQTMDYDGSLHYRVLGLQDEATTIAVYRGRSVGAWLPWITANQLEPLSDLQNAFGTMKLKTILAMPIKRQERDIKLFRKMGGFVRVQHRSR